MNYSEHFTVAELECPTSGKLVLAPGFIDNLEALRVAYNKPMAVTSGCRTDEHNKWLISRGYAASPRSFHLIGNLTYGTDTCAVDVKRPWGPHLHDLIRIATSTGWTVGLADTFIHLDRRGDYTDKPVTFYTY